METYLPVDYPKWLYNKRKQRQLVANWEAEMALKGEWGESPDGPFAKRSSMIGDSEPEKSEEGN